MSARVRPFLMFQGVQAEAAMNFYLSLFDDAEILQIQRYGAEGPGPEGSVLKALFRLGAGVLEGPAAGFLAFRRDHRDLVDADETQRGAQPGIGVVHRLVLAARAEAMATATGDD